MQTWQEMIACSHTHLNLHSFNVTLHRKEQICNVTSQILEQTTHLGSHLYGMSHWSRLISYILLNKLLIYILSLLCICAQFRQPLQPKNFIAYVLVRYCDCMSIADIIFWQTCEPMLYSQPEALSCMRNWGQEYDIVFSLLITQLTACWQKYFTHMTSNHKYLSVLILALYQSSFCTK